MRNTKIVIIMALLLAWSGAAFASENTPGNAAPAKEVQAKESEAREENLASIDDLLGEIAVPPAAAKIFNELYYQNKTELYQILNNNPHIIWLTLGILGDSLPALRSIAENQGKMQLDATTYTKANNLYEECYTLASPQLAADLESAKSYVDQRTAMITSESVIIDLNE